MLNPALEIEDHAHTVSLVVALGDYAAASIVINDSAIAMARLCLLDALGRGFESLRDPECASPIGPLVPGALMPGGARVPGTSLELDPAQAAFCNGLLLCRKANPKLGQESGSARADDTLGAILAVTDYQARKATMEGKTPPSVRDVLTALVKTLQIQGVLAPAGGYQPIGAATLRVLRTAAAALAAAQLGGTRGQIVTALSYACIDGGMWIDADGPQGGTHGDWATADALSRAVRHACQTMTASQSSYLTSAQLRVMDFAGKSLGAEPGTAKLRFGAGAPDRIACLYRPHDLAPVMARFQAAVDRCFPARQAERIKALFAAPERLDELPVCELLAALVTNGAR